MFDRIGRLWRSLPYSLRVIVLAQIAITMLCALYVAHGAPLFCRTPGSMFCWDRLAPAEPSSPPVVHPWSLPPAVCDRAPLPIKRNPRLCPPRSTTPLWPLFSSDLDAGVLALAPNNCSLPSGNCQAGAFAGQSLELTIPADGGSNLYTDRANGVIVVQNLVTKPNPSVGATDDGTMPTSFLAPTGLASGSHDAGFLIQTNLYGGQGGPALVIHNAQRMGGDGGIFVHFSAGDAGSVDVLGDGEVVGSPAVQANAFVTLSQLGGGTVGGFAPTDSSPGLLQTWIAPLAGHVTELSYKITQAGTASFTDGGVVTIGVNDITTSTTLCSGTVPCTNSAGITGTHIACSATFAAGDEITLTRGATGCTAPPGVAGNFQLLYP